MNRALLGIVLLLVCFLVIAVYDIVGRATEPLAGP